MNPEHVALKMTRLTHYEASNVGAVAAPRFLRCSVQMRCCSAGRLRRPWLECLRMGEVQDPVSYWNDRLEEQ